MNRSSGTRQLEKQGLLSTKLIPPRLPSALVPRPNLLARLDAGLERKVTVISAPPGAGKTTLVTEWLTAQQHDKPVPVGWVSLDASDNDPTRFWRYTITACRAFEGTPGRSALVALRSVQPMSYDGLLTSFINDLARLPSRCVLVLEDYHVLAAPEIHAALTFLIDHLPATLHIVLMTRTEPPLPLARWRARNELNEFTALDLRFSTAEAQAFLQQTVRTPITAELVARIEAKTEGWAAGLRLIALALHHPAVALDADQWLTTFSGGLRSVLDYLTGEVLAALPESTQTFLLQTSFLNPLTGAVCDAVTGRADSAIVLDHLERDNLFVVPLSGADGQRWYRYHALFAEVLRQLAWQRIDAATIRTWLGKASLWYEAHRFFDEAIETALSAHDSTRVAALIEWSLDARGNHELRTLHRWIAQLPVDVLYAHPALCFADAQARLFTADDRYAATTTTAVDDCLQAAERAWRAADNARGLGQVFALRATLALWRDNLSQAFLYAQRALELLPEQDADWRGISLLAIGIEQLLAGKVDVAQQTLLEARVLCRLGQNVFSALAATDMLARAYLAQAEFDQAEQLYRQIYTETDRSEALRNDHLLALTGLGTIAYERNELAAAEQFAAQISLDGVDIEEDLRMRATLLQARIQLALRHAPQAADLIRSLVVQVQRPLSRREALAWQARLAIATGDLVSVSRWAGSDALSINAAPHAQQELEALIGARYHIATDQSDAALRLLDLWRNDAHTHGRTHSEIEVLSVMALTHFAQADLAQAKPLLLKALILAQPKGCVRVFVDEGAAMKTLLQAVAPELTKRSLMTFAARVLQAFDPIHLAAPTPTSPLLEPLSPQEQRVLKLLAAGLSNPDIARELVVSTNTIKTQVKSIFNKLNVNNRAEAAEVARELNLL